MSFKRVWKRQWHKITLNIKLEQFHWNCNSLKVAQAIRNKENLLCLTISWSQYFQVPLILLDHITFGFLINWIHQVHYHFLWPSGTPAHFFLFWWRHSALIWWLFSKRFAILCLYLNICSAKILFHQSPTIQSDCIVTVINFWQSSDYNGIGSSDTILLAVIKGDYTLTVQSLYSHCT